MARVGTLLASGRSKNASRLTARSRRVRPRRRDAWRCLRMASISGRFDAAQLPVAIQNHKLGQEWGRW